MAILYWSHFSLISPPQSNHFKNRKHTLVRMRRVAHPISCMHTLSNRDVIFLCPTNTHRHTLMHDHTYCVLHKRPCRALARRKHGKVWSGPDPGLKMETRLHAPVTLRVPKLSFGTLKESDNTDVSQGERPMQRERETKERDARRGEEQEKGVKYW